MTFSSIFRKLLCVVSECGSRGSPGKREEGFPGFLDYCVFRVGRKPRRTRSFEKPLRRKNRVKAASLILKNAFLFLFLLFLPPLGRELLKSPSMASQVLPSPPHTRQRSSLASEFRMLSQPTCFDINKTMSEVSRLKLEAVCSFVSAGFFFRRGVF